MMVRRALGWSLSFGIFLVAFGMADEFRIAQGKSALAENDDTSALRIFTELASEGAAEAQAYLGAMYASGRGVPEDDAEAVKWFHRAASQGFAPAQYHLGIMTAHGEGVPEDDSRSVEWFRLAASQGLPPAQFNLGVMYASGEGTGKNLEIADMWLKLAGDNGYDDARTVREHLRSQLSEDSTQGVEA